VELGEPIGYSDQARAGRPRKRGSFSGRDNIFPLFKASIPVLKQNQPFIYSTCTRGSVLRSKAVKVKIKFTLEQATKDQRGSRGIALLFL
jgi:hypothetical protein